MTDELKEQVIVGDDAETFINSELGKNILEQAEKDGKAAMLAFHDCDPSDVKAVLKIQQDLRVALKFEVYLIELIQRGREALAAYKQQQG
jgi:hypothetical protein